jgi:hypothetical protein
MSTQTVYSRLQVLSVENEDRTSKNTGKEYRHFAARCIALDENSKPLNVCTVRSRQMAEGVRDSVKPGVFRVAFGGVIPDYGDDKGDLMPKIVVFTPEDVKAATPSSKAA